MKDSNSRGLNSYSDILIQKGKENIPDNIQFNFPSLDNICLLKSESPENGFILFIIICIFFFHL